MGRFCSTDEIILYSLFMPQSICVLNDILSVVLQNLIYEIYKTRFLFIYDKFMPNSKI